MQATAAARAERQARGEAKADPVLGSPAIFSDEVILTLPAKGFAIIALLSTEPVHAIPRHRIRVQLWAEFDQEKANANLRQTLMRVRRLEKRLGARILNDDFNTHRAQYRGFRSRSYGSAQCRYPRLAETGAGRASRRLLKAPRKACSAASTLPDGPFEDWRSEIQSRLRHKAVQALAALIHGAEGFERLAKQQAYAQQLLDIDPTEELGYRVLMETYEAQGERSLALQAYQRCRKILREELGVEPDIATTPSRSDIGACRDGARARAAGAGREQARGGGAPDRSGTAISGRCPVAAESCCRGSDRSLASRRLWSRM